MRGSSRFASPFIGLADTHVAISERCIHGRLHAETLAYSIVLISSFVSIS